MLLNNRYEFVKKLGEGVYGSVYLANDTLTGRYATIVIIST
jgi:serine/threonine protein kinase